MGLTEILSTADSITTVGLLIAIVYAFVRGYVVSARELKSVEAQRDQWQTVALKAMNLGERTVQVVKNGSQD